MMYNTRRIKLFLFPMHNLHQRPNHEMFRCCWYYCVWHDHESAETAVSQCVFPRPPWGIPSLPSGVFWGFPPLNPPPFDMVVRVVRLVLNGWGEEWKGGGLFLSSPEFLSFQYHLSSQHSQIRGALGSRVNTHTQPLSPSSKDTIWGGVYICPKAKRCIWCQVSKKWRIVDEKTKMVWRFLVFSSWREEFTRFCLRGSGWVDMETTTSEQKFSCLLYFHQKHSIHFHWWLDNITHYDFMCSFGGGRAKSLCLTLLPWPKFIKHSKRDWNTMVLEYNVQTMF